MAKKGKGEKQRIARKGDTVRIRYTGRLKEGPTFDSTMGRDPLELVLGEGKVLPAFEKAIYGMSSGETKTMEIPSDKAFGPRQESLVTTVHRKELPPEARPFLGQQIQSRTVEGQPITATVTALSATTITVDANHPLAGKDLVFEIELVEIR